MTEFLSALDQYKQSSDIDDREEPRLAMQIGNARLLDFGCATSAKLAVLLIPSLINRYYILDLSKKLSFARYLRDQGIRVFIVDWGEPSTIEKNFDCALYITQILLPMAAYIRFTLQLDVVYGGYCMGGLFALALACIRPNIPCKIALFATPWDFSVASFPHFALQESEVQSLKRYIGARTHIPAGFIHTLFHLTNPYAFPTKMREFAAMESKTAREDFIAVERWANDGVCMTPKVALDCLVHWTQYNEPARLQWRVDGQAIDPAAITVPAFLAVPRHDTVVPPNCACPLANILKNCHIVQPSSGHVSMMVGRGRKSSLWQPFIQWVLNKEK